MLIGAGTRRATFRGKQVGAGLWNAYMHGWNDAGRRNNRVLAEGGEWALGKSSVPAGRTHPTAWLMPISSGSMASRIAADFTLAGDAAMGLAAVGEISGESTFAGNGGLIASAVGSIDGVFTLSADIVALAAISGSIDGDITFTGNLGALAGLSGSIDGAFTLAATPYATATMSGGITSDTAALTAESVAAAVWDALAAAHNSTGTMGEKLNGAGSAGNPWTEMIESGMNAAQAMRLITAALAGKVSGAAGPVVTIRNAVADDADRIVATVDDDGNRTAITYDLD